MIDYLRADIRQALPYVRIGPEIDAVAGDPIRDPAQALALRTGPDDDMDLMVGDAVRHQLFGVGTVVEINGMTVSIAFDGRGIKKLNSAFAPLTRVS